MKILIDPSTLNCSNLGDVAMLQVAIDRLRALWPVAQIYVFTELPQALAQHCPNVSPLSHEGRLLWLKDHALLGGLDRYAPGSAVKVKKWLGNWLRRRCPGALAHVQMRAAGLRHRENEGRRRFLREMEGADLYLVSGNALLNDKNTSQATVVLNTMKRAARSGTPVVMLSQGVGPLSEPSLFGSAKAVLPVVSLLALRERVTGVGLVAALGIRPDRVMVTGDDAIDMVYKARCPRTGSGIGVNFRVAKSTDVPPTLIPVIRSVLQRAARHFGAPLVPLPIAFHSAADDPRWIREILLGLDNASDGGRMLATPAEVIAEAGRCRIIVTAAYHAAVFGLGQGVPVVALTYNDYYEQKFWGLAEMFPTGCEVINLQHAGFGEALWSSVETLWMGAEQLRDRILSAAAWQVREITKGYGRVHTIVEGWREREDR